MCRFRLCLRPGHEGERQKAVVAAVFRGRRGAERRCGGGGRVGISIIYTGVLRVDGVLVLAA